MGWGPGHSSGRRCRLSLARGPSPSPTSGRGPLAALSLPSAHSAGKRLYSSCPTGGGTVSKLLKDLADARPRVAENAAPSVTPSQALGRSLLLPKPHFPPKTAVQME